MEHNVYGANTQLPKGKDKPIKYCLQCKQAHEHNNGFCSSDCSKRYKRWHSKIPKCYDTGVVKARCGRCVFYDQCKGHAKIGDMSNGR